MKKLFLCLLLTTSIFTFGYTQTDTDNAISLAGKGIITTQTTAAGYRLDDNITRAELVGIALKLKGTSLPENYQCKKYFSDTVQNDWICRAIEIAADNGLVSRENKKFRPQDKITRAEALAILMKAGSLKSLSDIPDYNPGDCILNLTNTWQKKVICEAMHFSIIEDQNNFYPDKVANRKDVFSFSLKTITIKELQQHPVVLSFNNNIGKNYKILRIDYKILSDRKECVDPKDTRTIEYFNTQSIDICGTKEYIKSNEDFQQRIVNLKRGNYSFEAINFIGNYLKEIRIFGNIIVAMKPHMGGGQITIESIIIKNGLIITKDLATVEYPSSDDWSEEKEYAYFLNVLKGIKM